MLTVCRRCAAAYAYLFHKKGLLHETLCSSPLGSASAADAHTKQRKRFLIYALRPARPLPALFSLRTRSF